MKIQDILFLVLLALLFYKRDSRLAILFGLLSLGLSISLFWFWIFFTAERLTWYAAAFFVLAIIFQFYKLNKNGK